MNSLYQFHFLKIKDIQQNNSNTIKVKWTKVDTQKTVPKADTFT